MVKIGGKKYPRTRSISMSGNMNGTDNWATRPAFWYFRKLSEIVNPPPSKAFVFIDEREESIDDGFFLVFLDTGLGNKIDQWANLPAIYHNFAAGLSFCRWPRGNPEMAGRRHEDSGYQWRAHRAARHAVDSGANVVEEVKAPLPGRHFQPQKNPKIAKNYPCVLWHRRADILVRSGSQ